MDNEDLERYFEIKDKCRQGLVKFLHTALSSIEVSDNPKVLDIGCGTGVPCLAFAKKTESQIKAVDLDSNALIYLKDKIVAQKLSDRVQTENVSLFDLTDENETYDIVLAEGILHIVGFELGLKKIDELLKKKGYVLIHDELRDDLIKKNLFNKCGFNLLKSFLITEDNWWNLYYQPLENYIENIKINELKTLFAPDEDEIKLFRKDAKQFRSVYYVIQKRKDL